MRYKGHIHRLFLMLSEKESLNKEEVIDKIYELMNKDPEIIGGITRIEIEQVINSKLGYINENKIY